MTDLAVLGQALRDLLGPGIGVGVTDPTAPEGALWDAEKPAIARAIAKRRLEFTAGRVAARAAMADLGLPAAAIPMGPDRAPVWPAGLTGSIAHCRTACIAAIAPLGAVRSIGLDIEEATPLAPNLWEVILTPGERSWLATRPADDRGHLAKQIFSAKETVYKAQYPLTGRVLDFREVRILLTSDTFSAWANGFDQKHVVAFGRCIRIKEWILADVVLDV